MPNRQLPTLQQKMIEAAARRKIADRDRILVQALNAIQELDPDSSYEGFPIFCMLKIKIFLEIAESKIF
jgi:hypothetical protein